MAAGRGDHAIGELRQVGGGQGWHGECDEAGFTAVEIARGHVHLVSEAVDDFLYFFSRGVGHAPGMVDHVGCGFERNACLFGHVSQGDSLPVRFRPQL